MRVRENEYTNERGNSFKKVSTFLNRGYSVRKQFALEKEFITFRVGLSLVCMKTNRKSKMLSPLVKLSENLPGIPIPLK